jgi:hypothetical protein
VQSGCVQTKPLFDQEFSMKTSHLHASLLAVSLAMLCGPTPARERQTTTTGAQGKTATRNVNRSQGDVSSTTTGPNGKTSSRVVDRQKGQTTATVTGPNGETSTRQTTYDSTRQTTPAP